MKQALFGIILLFIVFLLGVYLVAPKYTQVRTLQKEVAKEELVLQQKQGYFSILQKISEGSKTHKEVLEKIQAALPEEFSLPSLLNFLQSKAAENGLILKNIGEVVPLPSAKIKEGGLHLVLRGTLPSFENFLKGLEKSSRLIEVETISLKQTGVEMPEFNLLIKVRAF